MSQPNKFLSLGLSLLALSLIFTACTSSQQLGDDPFAGGINIEEAPDGSIEGPVGGESGDPIVPEQPPEQPPQETPPPPPADDTTAPEIVETLPDIESSDITHFDFPSEGQRKKTISVTFSEPINIIGSLVDAIDSAPALTVESAGKISDNVIEIVFATELLDDRIYEIDIDRGVIEDLSGNVYDDHVAWWFLTAPCGPGDGITSCYRLERAISEDGKNTFVRID